MKNLFYNYVAIGEAVMEWVVAAYLNCYKRIAYLKGVNDEETNEDEKTIEVIESRIRDGQLQYLLPHANVDSQEFISKLKNFAEENKDEINPLPADNCETGKVWTKLNLTPERKNELDGKAYFEFDYFVRQMCDVESLEFSEDTFKKIKEYIDSKFETLSADEKKVLNLKYGLSGEPCMSVKEIFMILNNLSIFEIMTCEKNALVKLF